MTDDVGKLAGEAVERLALRIGIAMSDWEKKHAKEVIAGAIEDGINSRLTPVVLIGVDKENGRLITIGLYENSEAAGYAVLHDNLPPAYYSVMTPALGAVLSLLKEPK